MKQNKISFMFFAIAILGVLLISGCTTINNTAGEEDTNSLSEKGRLVMTMTDAAADMNSISEVRMTISNIEAHSKTEGWISLESKQQTYDLLDLNSQNKAELMADLEINPDEFTQVRFEIEEVVVVDSEGEHKAKVPSNQYIININSKVEANQTSTVEIDILADESLHITGNGEYIMAPVAKVETKSNAEVQIKGDNSVIVSKGKTTSKTTVGMDVNGNVGVGLKIPTDANLEINTLISGESVIEQLI